jgi:hypothetical protein
VPFFRLPKLAPGFGTDFWNIWTVLTRLDSRSNNLAETEIDILDAIQHLKIFVAENAKCDMVTNGIYVSKAVKTGCQTNERRRQDTGQGTA